MLVEYYFPVRSQRICMVTRPAISAVIVAQVMTDVEWVEGLDTHTHTHTHTLAVPVVTTHAKLYRKGPRTRMIGLSGPNTSNIIILGPKSPTT